VRLLCDHHVPPKFLTALRSIEVITVTMPSEVEALGPDADDTDIIAYAEEHDWVVFTDDRRFLIDDEGENSSGEPIDADCGVIFYTQNTVRQPGPTAEAIQAVAEAFSDHCEIDMYINDWIDRNW
jgi:hypothetical protein